MLKKVALKKLGDKSKAVRSRSRSHNVYGVKKKKIGQWQNTVRFIEDSQQKKQGWRKGMVLCQCKTA